MKQDLLRRGITPQGIGFDLGFAGLSLVIGCMALAFSFCAPDLFRLFAGAIALGCGIAIVLHFLNRSTTVNSQKLDLLASDFPHQGITMHRIRFGGGFAGLLFTVGCMAVFLTGLPLLWYPFVGALALGTGIATVLYFVRR